MIISFNNVIPKPLENANLSSSEVWNSQFEIKDTGHYLINASSGKGKSTLINIIYGLRQDYEGGIQFDGKDVSQFQMSDWASLRTNELSIVFQGLELFPKLSVLENIFIKNKLTDFKTESEIRQILKALEIEGFANKKAGALSMGQQQRVAIVRSLCQPFNCLLLDEPFSHLDDGNIDKAWQLIAGEVATQNAKTIITTLGNNYGIQPTKTLML